LVVDDGGGSAGEVVRGGVAGLSIGGAGGFGDTAVLGAGRSGPLMPQPPTLAAIAAISAAASALLQWN
jgi:hypothetical protein